MGRLQAIYLKFAEYVDIGTLVQIINANSRMIGQSTMGILGVRKWKLIFYFQEGFQQSVFHCCVTVNKFCCAKSGVIWWIKKNSGASWWERNSLFVFTQILIKVQFVTFSASRQFLKHTVHLIG